MRRAPSAPSRSLALVSLSLVAAVACTNDYGRFAIGSGGSGPSSTTDATGTGATTGTGGGASTSTDASTTSTTGPTGTGGAGGATTGGGGAGGGGGCVDVAGSCEPWWDTDWTLRRRIQIDTAGVTEDLASFPVLIRLDATTIDYAATLAAGKDVRFVADDGSTVLDRDIESWNTAGTSAVWVRVPKFPMQGAGPITLWLYYGNSGAPNPNNPKATWASSFVSVHHLNAGFTDATTAHDGTAAAVTNTPTSAAGRVAGGMNFDGVDDHVELAGEAPFDFTTSLTVSLWIRPETFTKQWQAFVTKGDTAWRFIRDDNNPKIDFGSSHTSMSSDGFPSLGTISLNQWHHIAMTYDGATKWLYVDGAPDNSKAFTQVIAKNNVAVTFGENLEYTGRFFDGDMDEVRISSVPRSAAWLRLEREIVSNGALVTFSAEQLPPP